MPLAATGRGSVTAAGRSCLCLRRLGSFRFAAIGREFPLPLVEPRVRGLQPRRDVAYADACGLLALAGGEQTALALPRGLARPPVIRAARRLHRRTDTRRLWKGMVSTS